ncbi:M56 family metallopeptidase [Pseudonocardia kujensis]|uniref:M56 family metallopeptidase n=1 Tax=Pseudonocardia kujensis TaxID=1128675 RepID=UPI001E33D2AC|nr:M56 family metallopeptidase [Pseudonocardia kujensis]MCE0766471.1 M56 family metallopeptidase [Pseudonocardia kujensis]
MVLASVLIVGAVVTSLLAPRLFRGLERTSASPVGLLYVWWSALAGVGLSAVVALGAVLVPDRDDGSTPAHRFLTGCWTALASSRLHLHLVAAVVLGAVLAVGLLRLGRRVRRSRRAARDRAETTIGLLEPAGDWEQGVLWVEHREPLVFTIGGRTRAIVATTGLRDRLSPAETDAVLAHERAHLSGRHHLQVLLAETLGATFPMLPLFRQAPVAVRRLIELAADDEAAGSVGADVVRRALVTVAARGRIGLPPAALGAAAAATELRLARLARPVRRPARPARLGEQACFVAAGALIPVVAGTGALAALALVSCL